MLTIMSFLDENKAYKQILGYELQRILQSIVLTSDFGLSKILIFD